jgi:hypothetical protein
VFEPRSFRSTAIAVLAFAIAMGYLEAAVVVYLRAALEVAPSVGPPQDPNAFGSLQAMEMARELATLVMIAAAGWLAGRNLVERVAWAAVVFGCWDVVYYLGLRLAIGWPPSIGTLDVLFLVPVPWIGPVWAPILVSIALVGFGLAVARRVRTGAPMRIGWMHALGGVVGGALVVASFLVDAEQSLESNSAAWTGWPLFWAGLAVAAAAAISALRTRPRASGPAT